MSESSRSEPPSTAVGVLHLSSLLGEPVDDLDGNQIGRLADVIVRLGDGGNPPLSGLVLKSGGNEFFAHMYQVAELGSEKVVLKSSSSQLGPFERRQGEVLLGRDVLARHLIHLKRVRLIRANEIELAFVNGRWEVVGVDPTSKPVWRRLLPRTMRNRVKEGGMVDWAEIEPFVSHVPSARLRLPLRKLAKIHPAQLADLVESASHDEGEEIIRAVGENRELEADVFEELDTEHQVEFLASRSDGEAARLLSAMAPDDAVDLLEELDQERRLPILRMMPGPMQRKLRSLLRYNPETAGGLMNPDFVEVASTSSVGEALDAVRNSHAPAEVAGVVFVSDASRRLMGTVLVAELLRAKPSSSVETVARQVPAALHPDADVHEVLRTMSDFNLAVAPVVDSDQRILGQITVDDVLELLIPEGWRRQYGMTSTSQ
jgi:CBS domain-containing protein